MSIEIRMQDEQKKADFEKKSAFSIIK